MDYKIAGCVILYNPKIDTIDNILSYIRYIEQLYIIDNGGGGIVYSRFADNPKVKFIQHKENMGIAYSFNEVLKDAEGKFELLLTMDQDSCFFDDSMKTYVNEIPKFDWSKTLAIGPKIVEPDFCMSTDSKKSSTKWNLAENMITSGNIISVKNALHIGGFDEDLFIDEVDSDFIYKGREAGFDIFTNETGVYLLHSVGNPSNHRFLGLRTKVQNHNKVRKYYIFRNRFVVLKKHYQIIGPRRAWNYYIKANISLVRDVLFFENDKWSKLKYMATGFIDFLIGRLGKKY